MRCQYIVLVYIPRAQLICRIYQSCSHSIAQFGCGITRKRGDENVANAQILARGQLASNKRSYRICLACASTCLDNKPVNKRIGDEIEITRHHATS